MNIWDDPKNYKPCQYKTYEVHACMPPFGTVVVDRLTKPDTVRLLGKTHFTVKDIENLSKNDRHKLKTLESLYDIQVTTKQAPFVIAGVTGNLSIQRADDFMEYNMYVKNDQSVRITEQLLMRLSKGNYLDWITIRPKRLANKLFACFVPSSIHGSIPVYAVNFEINASGVGHGKGDFVIAPSDSTGKYPDLNGTKFVVNGEAFPKMFDNRGWKDEIDYRFVNNNITLKDLPNLIP